jgi:hypothetical protein
MHGEKCWFIFQVFILLPENIFKIYTSYLSLQVSGFCLMMANEFLYQIVLPCPACDKYLDVGCRLDGIKASFSSTMPTPEEVGKMYPNNIHALHLIKLLNAEPSLPEIFISR